MPYLTWHIKFVWMWESAVVEWTYLSTHQEMKFKAQFLRLVPMNFLPLSVPSSISVSIGVFPIGQLRCTMKSADWHFNLLNVTPTMILWSEFTNRLYMCHLVDKGTAIPHHTFHSNTSLISTIQQQCHLSWMIGVLITTFANSLIVQIPPPYHFST